MTRTFKAEVKKATMLLPMATTGTNCKPSQEYTSFCFFLPLLLFNCSIDARTPRKKRSLQHWTSMYQLIGQSSICVEDPKSNLFQKNNLKKQLFTSKIITHYYLIILLSHIITKFNGSYFPEVFFITKKIGSLKVRG